MNDIEQRIKDVIAKQLGVSKADIKPETNFVNDLGADSLDRVELTMALEDEFNLVIDDTDAEKFATLQGVLNYVNKAKGIEVAEDVQDAAVVQARAGEQATSVALEDL